jgi:hypothetical protein
MEREAVNPWDWSLKIGFNQAEIIEGQRRQLICSGQTSMDADGNPRHPGDMRAQVTSISTSSSRASTSSGSGSARPGCSRRALSSA